MKATARRGWKISLVVAGLAGLATTGALAGAPSGLEEATFAGGCFWSMELAMHSVPGVTQVTAGYTGGTVANPSYEQVSAGDTGHVEAVKVLFDPKQVTYARLLDAFWHHVDPTDAQGQFCDSGPEYRSEIFVHGAAQQQTAEASLAALRASGKLGKPVVTRIVAAGPFYAAEDYHQDYARKNPARYGMYRVGCGRDRRLTELWGKDPGPVLGTTQGASVPEGAAVQHAAVTQPAAAATGKTWRDRDFQRPQASVLRSRLTPAQYEVTQQEGTEPPFHNAFWDNHAAGIYVDVVSGEPLFSSTDKFDSGTGWPSFTRPLEKANVTEKVDRSMFATRTEVRSARADSHLGHVFEDGPAPTGLRYCINSAALRFIPAEKLVAEGYGEYARLFTAQSAR